MMKRKYKNQKEMGKFRYIVYHMFKTVLKSRIKQIGRNIFIVPFGKLRKPLPVAWGGLNSNDDNYKYPKCPHCDEALYRMDFCVFCGQKIINN